MNRTKYETESVPTNTLRVGDIIIAHGGIFKVVEVHDFAEYGRDEELPAEERGHVNLCEYLGKAYDDYECQIPAHWRDGAPDPHNPGRRNLWNEQGNHLARSCRILRYTENYPCSDC